MAKAKTKHNPIASEDKARLIAGWLFDKKAENVTVMDVAAVSPITEYLVIATATGPRHAKGLASYVLDMAGKEDIEYLGMEGQGEGQWILVDLNDVLVHVFSGDNREFYNLEGLWSEGREVGADDG